MRRLASWTTLVHVDSSKERLGKTGIVQSDMHKYIYIYRMRERGREYMLYVFFLCIIDIAVL